MGQRGANVSEREHDEIDTSNGEDEPDSPVGKRTDGRFQTVLQDDFVEREFAKLRAEFESCRQELPPLTEEQRQKLKASFARHEEFVVELTAALTKLREPVSAHGA